LSRSSRRMNAHCAQFWAAADSVRYYRSDPFCPSLFQFTPCPHPPVSLLDISRCVCVLCVLLAAASQAHPIVSSPPFSYFSLYLSISLSFSPPSPIVHKTFILFYFILFFIFSNTELTHTTSSPASFYIFISLRLFCCCLLLLLYMRVSASIDCALWGLCRN
jgi:hypothetical protein